MPNHEYSIEPDQVEFEENCSLITNDMIKIILKPISNNTIKLDRSIDIFHPVYLKNLNRFTKSLRYKLLEILDTPRNIVSNTNSKFSVKVCSLSLFKFLFISVFCNA